MPKNVPTKKAPAKTEAAPAAPVAATKEWTDLEIAAQLEVLSDGSVCNPFTKEVIAKDSGGLLDVRRPGGADLPKPEGVKINGSVAATFAKWYMEKCYIAPVTPAEASERFKKEITFPEIEVDVAQTPLAFVTAKLGSDTYGFHVINGQIARAGKRTDRGFVWAASAEFIKVRGAKMYARATRGDALEIFKSTMRSFSGKFRAEASAPKEKPAAKPAKTPPAKVPAKKVPTKK